jgi:dTDP-4-dehydrorhamnose reductase
MKKILVTGANGQLGKCLQDASVNYKTVHFDFVPRSALDITNSDSLKNYFAKNKPDYCINAAAYTHVDNAEKEPEKAFLINAEAVKDLAKTCKEHHTTLLHISTDYVFDGTKNTPYKEEDSVKPINVYGASKLKGEKYIQEIAENYFIIRTSWLYSQYGHNFFKTIIKNLEAGKNLTITTEQVGVPTNANDLAEILLKIVQKDSLDFGIYHFSNKGEATWYDFAKAIAAESQINAHGNIASINHYPTFAKRPSYSVLDTSKIIKTFEIAILHWKQSLQNLLTSMSYGTK